MKLLASDYQQWWAFAQRAYQCAEHLKKYSPIANYNQYYLATSKLCTYSFFFLR